MRKISHYLPFLFGDAVQNLVHLHASGVPVVSETNDDHAVLLRKDGLVYLPAIVQMRKHVRHLERACAAGRRELPAGHRTPNLHCSPRAQSPYRASARTGTTPSNRHLRREHTPAAPAPWGHTRRPLTSSNSLFFSPFTFSALLITISNYFHHLK